MEERHDISHIYDRSFFVSHEQHLGSSAVRKLFGPILLDYTTITHYSTLGAAAAAALLFELYYQPVPQAIYYYYLAAFTFLLWLRLLLASRLATIRRCRRDDWTRPPLLTLFIKA